MKKGSHNSGKGLQMEMTLRPLYQYFPRMMGYLSEGEKRCLGKELLPFYQRFLFKSTMNDRAGAHANCWESHWLKMSQCFSFLSFENCESIYSSSYVCPFCDFMNNSFNEVFPVAHHANIQCMVQAWQKIMVMVGCCDDVTGDVIIAWSESWTAEMAGSYRLASGLLSDASPETPKTRHMVSVMLQSLKLVVTWLAPHRQELFHSSSCRDTRNNNTRNELGWVGVFVRAVRCYHQVGLDVMIGALRRIFQPNKVIAEIGSYNWVNKWKWTRGSITNAVEKQREWLLSFFDVICLLLDYHASMETFCAVFEAISPEVVLCSYYKTSNVFHPAERWWYKEASAIINNAVYGSPRKIALQQHDVINSMCNDDEWLTMVSQYESPERLRCEMLQVLER